MRKNISNYRKLEPAQLSLRARLLLSRRLHDIGLDLQFDNIAGFCPRISHDKQVHDLINSDYESHFIESR